MIAVGCKELSRQHTELMHLTLSPSQSECDRCLLKCVIDLS